MILKIHLFVSTIISFWPHVARCESDSLSELVEKNTAVTSVPGVELVEGANENNDHINHVKPVVNNVDVSAKDYQKFYGAAHRFPGHMDFLRSNINVNVNHRDFPKLRWTKYPPDRLNHQQVLYGHAYSQPMNNRVFDIIRRLPNANIEVDGLRPQDLGTRLKKYPFHKKVNTSRGDSDELASTEEENNNQCRPIVHEALDYLKRVEIHLRNLDRDLRLLIVGS